MRKVYSLLFMASVSALAYAQTLESPLTLEGGSASYTWSDDNTDDVYWKYTNTEGHSVLFTTTSYSLTFLKADGTTTLSTLGSSAGTSYPVVADGSILLRGRYSTYNTSLSFTYSTEEVEYQETSTADAPMAFVEGKTYMVVDNKYLQYEATADGVLLIASPSYISQATSTVDGVSTSLTFNYNSSAQMQQCKLPVEAGKSYLLYLSSYSPFKLTAELTHPVQGATYDYALDLVEGENTVPAAYGEYWYSFTASQSGNLEISSDDATLAASTISFYNSASNASYNSATASSTAGSFSLRIEVSQGSTYYVKITKSDATTADQKFTMQIAAFEAGDRADNPIVLTSGEAQTLKSATGNAYYSIEVPAGEDMILEVTSTGVTSSSSYVSIYNKNYGSYSGSSYYGTNAASISMTATAGVTYMLAWTANESAPISFTATLKAIAEGDTYDKAIEAVEGMNLLPETGTKYYKYTATLTGKLSILPTDVTNTTITFPRGSSQYSGDYTATVSNGASEIDVTAGTTYVIKITSTGLGFVLSEREYEQGESDSNPIPMVDGVYTLGNEPINVWVSYTVESDGILVIGGDMEGDYSGTKYVEYKKQGGYASRAFDGSKITASVPVSAGDVYLLHIVTPDIQEGKTVTVTVNEYGEGQSLNLAIEMKADVATVLPAPSRTVPTWTKVNVQSGDLIITREETSGAYGYLYNSYESAQSGSYNTYISLANYMYDASYNYVALDKYQKTVTLSFDEPTTIYIKYESANDVTPFTLTYSGSAVVAEEGTTAINSVKAAAQGGVVRVFDLYGRQVDAKSYRNACGTYIVVENGVSRKEIIK